MGRKRNHHRSKKGKVSTVSSPGGDEKGESNTATSENERSQGNEKDDNSSENVLFSLDQVVDAVRECYNEISTVETPEDDDNPFPAITSQLITETDSPQCEEEIIPDLSVTAHGVSIDMTQNNLRGESPYPSESKISIAPIQNLQQNDEDGGMSIFSQEVEGFEGINHTGSPHQEFVNECENGAASDVQLVCEDDTITGDYQNKGPQPMSEHERAFFQLVAESDDPEYLKNLVISQSNPLLLFGSGDNDEEEGCLTQHYVTYTTDDNSMQEVINESEGYQQTQQILQLPSGEVVHLEEGENLIHLDENMNFVAFATPSEIAVQEGMEVEKDVKAEDMILHNHDEMAMPKNFACDLCSEAFEKKLQLNNHKDRRHGVKFVFTEKGKKVKLVRMPKDFEFRTGEKLDPCVSLLIEHTNKNGKDGRGAIGVQIVEDTDSLHTPFHVLNQEASISKSVEDDELVTEENWESFQCGFLTEIIKTAAIVKAKLRQQTPFIAFYPYQTENRDNSFLMRIVPVNHERNLLVPATPQDVAQAKGAVLQGTSYIHNDNHGAGSSREVTSKCRRDYKIPIVATLRQFLDEENQRYELRVDSPDRHNPVKQIDFLPHDRFSKYCQQQTQGEKVRTLIEAANPMPPPPKPRKPYQRRALRSLANISNISHVASASIVTVKPPYPNVEIKPESQETPLISQPENIIRPRRCLKKEFIDPEEVEDPSYEPTPTPRAKPAVIVGVTGRKRGRPRKVAPEGVEECPQKIQKRGPKQRRELTELIQAVENMMKKEKTSDGYEGI